MKELNRTQMQNVTGGYFIIHGDDPVLYPEYNGQPLANIMRSMRWIREG